MDELTMSVIPSALTRPVLEGRVPVAGAVIHAEAAQSVNTNSLQMLDLAFDVGEMSLATFTKAREQGVPLMALPLFTGRRFLYGAVVVSESSGIRDFAQLRGRRVGLPQFWMTSSVWHRLILRQAHGIAQSEISWVTAAPERMGALGLPSEAHQDASGRSPQELLAAGEIDAVMGPGAGPDRGQRDTGAIRLAADPAAAARAYYERSGVFPIMHMIVMKEELANREPSLVASLCDAFEQAKELSREESPEGDRPIPGLSQEETRALFGDDPFAYGIQPNRKVLETFLGDVLDQGLIDRSMKVEELFAENLPERYR